MSDLFAGSFAKVKRTEAQINDFGVAVRAFFDGSPYERFSEVNPDAFEEVWKFRLTSVIPLDIAVRAGEVLFNLRSALDQVACALAIKHSGLSKDTYFPFGKTLDIFERELPAKTKKLPPDAIDLIRTLQPYKGGNDLLWSLHDLNRQDKHVSLVPVNLYSSTVSGSDIKARTGDIYRVGPRLGQHMVRTIIERPDGSIVRAFVQHDPLKRFTMRKVGDRWRMEFAITGDAPPEEQMDYLTCSIGAKFEEDFQPSFNIAFGNIEILKTEPVLAVLHQMRQLVEGIILAFDGRFG